MSQLYENVLTVEVRGHSWVTDQKPPAIDGWRIAFVEHHGLDRTIYTYHRLKT